MGLPTQNLVEPKNLNTNFHALGIPKGDACVAKRSKNYSGMAARSNYMINYMAIICLKLFYYNFREQFSFNIEAEGRPKEGGVNSYIYSDPFKGLLSERPAYGICLEISGTYPLAGVGV